MKEKIMCLFLPEQGMEPWEIELIPMYPFECREYEVNARYSRFNIIMDKYSQGTYICVPNWGIDIVEPEDFYWNYEHLKTNYPNKKM